MRFASRLSSLGLLSALSLLIPWTAQAQFTARVQAIHNAPDPSVAVVDLYANGILLLDDVAFRTASPYLDAPAFIPLEIGVAPGTSTSAAEVFYTFSITLQPNQTVQFIAVGVREPGDFAPNPDGLSTALNVLVNDDARETTADPTMAEVNVVHGSPDAPTVDVGATVILTGEARGGVLLADEIAYTGLTSSVAIEPHNVIFIEDEFNSLPFGSYWATPELGPGVVATVLLSGFLDPTQNQDGPSFSPMIVLSDGAAMVLDPVVVAVEHHEGLPGALAIRSISPNPSASTVRIIFDLAEQADVTAEVFDALGRQVLTVAPQARPVGAGQHIRLDTAELPAGAYVLRLTADGQTQSRRIAVVK
ncbi:MAG: DUF4397 domain-containing protein [Rhodothermaceae bacterium]|nr:DUF4397 domain-containing protein [Rhodothermaceae bacterium]